MSTIAITDSAGTTFVFDVVREYMLTSEVSVTDHPVETGANVSDHAQKLPKKLAFKGLVTESPFDYQDTTGGVDRVTRALEWLDSIAGTLVTVVTEVFGTFSNMAITRYPTSRSSMKSLEFDCEFKQVILATAGLVDIPAEAPVAESAAAAGLPDAQDVGEQPTTDVGDTAATASDQSALLSLTEALGISP